LAWIGATPPARFCVRRRAGYLRPSIWDKSDMVMEMSIKAEDLRVKLSDRSASSENAGLPGLKPNS